MVNAFPEERGAAASQARMMHNAHEEQSVPRGSLEGGIKVYSQIVIPINRLTLLHKAHRPYVRHLCWG